MSASQITPELIERYKRVNNFMDKVKNLPLYELVKVEDEDMGIHDIEPSSCRNERKRFLALLGSNATRMGKYTYTPTGQFSYVVVFRVEA